MTVAPASERTIAGSLRGNAVIAAAHLEREVRMRRGGTGRNIRDLLRLQRAPEAVVREDQDLRLRALLRYAASHVPYYAAVLRDSGVVDDRGGVHLDRFIEIPLLERATVIERHPDMVSNAVEERQRTYDMTGGSTGHPVPIVRDRANRDWLRALPVHVDQMLGRHPGERRLYLWGSARDVNLGRDSFRTRMGRRMRRELFLDAFRISEKDLSEFASTFNGYRPDHVVAYAESIFQLARFIEEQGVAVHSPRSISTGAATLERAMRDTIQRVFRTPVFNQYGSREIGGIACECERHEGMHVTMPGVLAEVLRPDGTPAGPGELGEIVLTSLYSYAQPFIRYRLGDVGSWAAGPCSCGRSWPLLESVAGRISSTFVTADGSLVVGEFFNLAFRGAGWIKQFQVVQQALGSVHCYLVPLTDDIGQDRQRDLDDIRRRIRQAMGDDCAVAFHFVKEIEVPASGKSMYTISHVPIEQVWKRVSVRRDGHGEGRAT